ncbi:MAG: DUF2867 domain-containing protein [Betaproteobacteria bacterium]|nr:DUF2867 domain-containing protein [Betaproteobacteria bacterium]
MISPARVDESFPSVRIASQSGGLAVEVSLIAQLGHGAGNHLYGGVAARQRNHAAFVDELDEPSTRIGGTDFGKGDSTSLYSFVVGPRGHPFHRHAGHRVFTAVSGSGGAQLRFSTASDEQLAADPQNFFHAMRRVNIPADCLFTVRFGGETWHQFAPLARNSLHPVFFALSCHTDELGGNLTDEAKRRVLANEANIPSLTELLPESVAELMSTRPRNLFDSPVTTLSLDAPAGSWHRAACDFVRSVMGQVRGAWSTLRRGSGYVSFGGSSRSVIESRGTPATSILNGHLADLRLHHDDSFRLRLSGADFSAASATRTLAAVLDGFINNPPLGVSRLMLIRNVLVSPLRLRTSPLGCPVSSLLSKDTSNLFAGLFPVIDQRVDAGDRQAEVVLGADDKHLAFRSSVGVAIVDSNHIDVTFGTRVHCKNGFGRFYMGAIDLFHRRYVSPTMLRFAVEYAAPSVEELPVRRSPSMKQDGRVSMSTPARAA